MMRFGQGFSARAAVAAVAFSMVVATAGIATATAAGASRFGGPSTSAKFAGSATQPVADPTCPRDPGFTSGVNFREQISGRVESRVGSGRVSLDLCRIFSGAMGGIDIRGSFRLATRIGTLRGTATGAISFSVPNTVQVVLTVRRASFLLSHVTGTLDFAATESIDHPGLLAGSVTPHLTLMRGPGYLSHPVPWVRNS